MSDLIQYHQEASDCLERAAGLDHLAECLLTDINRQLAIGPATPAMAEAMQRVTRLGLEANAWRDRIHRAD